MPREKSFARRRLEKIVTAHDEGNPIRVEDDPTIMVQNGLIDSLHHTNALSNAHDFDIEKWSEFWSHSIQSSGLSLAVPSDVLSVLSVQQTTSLEEVLEVMATLARDHPQWQTKLLDASCEVDLGKGKGRLHVNVETSGIFEGVTRREVGIFEFEEDGDGNWKVVDIKTLSGAQTE